MIGAKVIVKPSVTVVTTGALLLGGALRLAGLATDFWLDEIWAHRMAGSLTAWTDVFTRLNVDGNHHLMTLWIYFIGQSAPEWLYRLPAIIGGIVPLVAIYVSWRKSREPELAVFLILVATSYPLCHYASEARGYSIAAGITILLWLWCRHDYPKGVAMLLLYNAALVVGVLANLTFLFCCVGFGIMMIQREVAKEQNFTPRNLIKHTFHSICRHLLALAVIALLYAVDIRYMAFGLAQEQEPVSSSLEALSWLLSGGGDGTTSFVTVLIFAGLQFAGLWALWKRRHLDHLAFGIGLIGSITVIWTLRYGSHIHVRYFIVLLPFTLWSLAVLWRQLSGSRPGLRVAYAGISVCVVLGTWHSVRLAIVGRGQYANAVKLIGKMSPNTEISITTDFDFRGEMILQFYSGHLPAGKTFLFVPNREVHTAKPEWVVIQKAKEFDLLRLEDNSAFYEHVRSFPISGISGTEWHLYQLR